MCEVWPFFPCSDMVTVIKMEKKRKKERTYFCGMHTLKHFPPPPGKTFLPCLNFLGQTILEKRKGPSQVMASRILCKLPGTQHGGRKKGGCLLLEKPDSVSFCTLFALHTHGTAAALCQAPAINLLLLLAVSTHQDQASEGLSHRQEHLSFGCSFMSL